MSGPNDPAYPTDESALLYDSEVGRSVPVVMSKGGLTIRQRFVMAAMQGLLASNICDDLAYAHEYASGAVRFADAALAEEARTRNEK